MALFQNPGILYYYLINKDFSYFILFYCCGSIINIYNMASRATNAMGIMTMDIVIV